MPDTATSRDLGRGFIDSTKTIAPGCITGVLQKQLIENPKLEYSAGEDAENTFMELSGRVRGSVNLLVAGASAGYQFVQSKTNDENGLSSFINVTYAAAAELGVSPAAISKIMKQLESRLGVILFHRTTRATHLTEAGERFLQKAGPAVDQILLATKEVGTYADPPMGLPDLSASAPAIISL